MSLAIIWTQGIRDPEKKKQVEDTIRNSTVALSRLKKIILDRIEELATKTRLPPSTSDYALSQAHMNGGILELEKIDQLLSFLENK